MFGSLQFTLPAGPAKPPSSVPPPTPINFPQLLPPLDGSSSSNSDSDKSDPSPPALCLVPLLQSIRRPAEVRGRHLAALGVHVTRDAPLSALVPDPATIPDFAKWDKLTLEDVSVPMNERSQKSLVNGERSPGVIFYLERKNELSYANQVAFRAVRRMTPTPGQDMTRLGNAFEFYKRLETMANYWDDPSDPWSPPEVPEPDPSSKREEGGEGGKKEGNAAGSSADTNNDDDGPPIDPNRVTYRSSQGKTMPPDARHGAVAALLRMVVYEFKCNISPARTEPRLQLREPPPLSGKSKKSASKTSYFPSGCTFGFRTPKTRAEARSGVVEGPIFALSTRNSTIFSSEMDHTIDLGREIVAALITAQHRAREGGEEKRFGDGQWWCNKPRWGGGTGIPIGREIDPEEEQQPPTSNSTEQPISSSRLFPQKANATESKDGGSGGGGNDDNNSFSSTRNNLNNVGAPQSSPPSKIRRLPPRKPTKAMAGYGVVRPPAWTWDKKARYMALGKAQSSDVDEIFVVSSLFHHVSFLRVRVPKRLLEVLDGAPQGDDSGKASDPLGSLGADWGGLEVVRSRWFDLFIAKERIAVLQHMWGVMSWVMREMKEGEKRVVVTDRGGGKMDVDGDEERDDGQCKNQ